MLLAWGRIVSRMKLISALIPVGDTSVMFTLANILYLLSSNIFAGHVAINTIVILQESAKDYLILE